MAGARPIGFVIVAHPDDEVLWCGGWIMANPDWTWRVITLCRASDPDRAPRFAACMEHLGATGSMGDLDDGPDQRPLSDGSIDAEILRQLGRDTHAQLVLTHGPDGEYTRHLRHEECHDSVVRLWHQRRIDAAQVWCFAYSDGNRSHCPRAAAWAPHRLRLDPAALAAKRLLITGTYGFSAGSWEAECMPVEEAFFPVERS